VTLNLHIIIASTRPGRVGPTIASWFDDFAKAHGAFQTSLVDLATFKLPVYDEAKHPRLRDYQHEHTKAWSASVAAADAYVFVTPEYNFNPPPALTNALNYVYTEWNYKPAGVVSYGGLSAGLRSAQSLKQLLTALRIMPIPEGVGIPNFTQFISAEKMFTPNDLVTAGARLMLDELSNWARALKPMRKGA
jgi:NAD(P)H-dependent FMN reductase